MLYLKTNEIISIMRYTSQKPFQNRGRKTSQFGRRNNRSVGAGRGGERINVSKFINKASVTEEVENFVPEHKFQDFKIGDALKKAIVDKGYDTPTPIQDRAIPHVLQGADLLGIANTGTGKTGAFIIPLIHKVRLDPREQVLIVVPTRELAIQIDNELKSFAPRTKTEKQIFSVCCIGGASIGKQISELRYQYNFIIGTPGRLKDLIERRMINLSEFNTVVLDEADRMLDMGFIDDMRFIMSGAPEDRQKPFFSATLSREVEKLISEFLREPVRISVKTGDTAKNVEQDVVRVDKNASKFDVLNDLLNNEEFSRVLIFGRTKHGVEKLSRLLAQKGFKAESIHGDKNHSKRQHPLAPC